MNPALEAALELHKALNCNVFPIPRGSKKPMLSWRPFQKRRLTTDEVEDLFSPNPNANIAVVCGRVSNLLVLDADAPDVLRKWGHPETPVAETARGRHIYFQLPMGMTVRSTTAIADGLDIRAEGGYVLAPPSLHPTGKTYTWIIPPVGYLPVEPAPPPSWLIELLTKHRARSGALEISHIAHGVPEGKRNSAAASYAGFLLAALPEDRWETDVWPTLRFWNLQNKPPLPEQELRRVFQKMAAREHQRRLHAEPKELRLTRALQKLTQHLKLSQRQLSKLTQIPQQTLSRWFAEATEAPSKAPLWGNGSNLSKKCRSGAEVCLKSDPRVTHGDS